MLQITMPSILAKNIKNRMKELGLTQKSLAEKTGMSQAMVHKLSSGKTDKTSKILELASVLECSPDWLRDGSPNGFTQIKSDNFELIQSNLCRIPLISWVQAGAWAEVVMEYAPEDCFTEWRETSAKVSSSSFALKIKGDSMTNPYGAPSIPEGSIVIVDPYAEALSGKIVIAKLDDSNEATIKKLMIDGSQKFLVPLNPRYPTMPINGNCSIIGVVKKVEFDL